MKKITTVIPFLQRQIDPRSQSYAMAEPGFTQTQGFPSKAHALPTSCCIVRKGGRIEERKVRAVIQH